MKIRPLAAVALAGAVLVGSACAPPLKKPPPRGGGGYAVRIAPVGGSYPSVDGVLGALGGAVKTAAGWTLVGVVYHAVLHFSDLPPPDHSPDENHSCAVRGSKALPSGDTAVQVVDPFWHTFPWGYQVACGNRAKLSGRQVPFYKVPPAANVEHGTSTRPLCLVLEETLPSSAGLLVGHYLARDVALASNGIIFSRSRIVVVFMEAHCPSQ